MGWADVAQKMPDAANQRLGFSRACHCRHNCMGTCVLDDLQLFLRVRPL
ncbi:Uncharacterized protein PAT23_4207 [Pseudomonas aeruginosa]|nr:hypothetical protein CSB94_3798 [Pseudomonas aeruginosa]CDH78784.1 hypothetical protein PAMH27_4401 [Pseudomonas aeruginosa MH27]BAK88650.1 hypothetical protein NCGM2_1790 [Pseudomonas aeruginosa NCGM2.S1]QEN57838.1 Uncharacterized protein PAT23_4207 [Pseudomonas aeruginosa]QEO35797.1 Uncharacterized protein PAT169_1791 [Pseudomonas aeruginosa]